MNPNEYPSWEVYELLYARYLDPSKTQRLLALAGDLTGKRVLDLCCGNGRLGHAAIQSGAKWAFFVDEQQKMMDPKIIETAKDKKNTCLDFSRSPHSKYIFAWETVGRFLGAPPRPPFNRFDVVFCQQGVNYWFDQPIGIPSVAAEIKNWAHGLHRILSDNGVFIFNTFSNKPSTTPTTKQYHFQGFDYVEISWLVGNTVRHVQICEIIEPHYTTFRWIPQELFEELLSPYFDVELIPNGSSVTYKCIRK